MPYRATQDIQVMVESSDKTSLLDTGMANHYTILSLNPKKSMKRQKDRTFKDELPRLVGTQYATGEWWRNNSRENEETQSQSENNAPVWM